MKRNMQGFLVSKKKLKKMFGLQNMMILLMEELNCQKIVMKEFIVIDALKNYMPNGGRLKKPLMRMMRILKKNKDESI